MIDWLIDEEEEARLHLVEEVTQYTDYPVRYSRAFPPRTHSGSIPNKIINEYLDKYKVA